MGFFKRDTSGTPRGMTPCPVCNELLTKNQAKMNGGHFDTHVYKVESGPQTGGYTWKCSCGPADSVWPGEVHALAGLVMHLQQGHGLHDVI
jgi:hypothetical protein